MPLALVVVAVATPIADLLNPANANAHCDRAEVVHATSFMLVVFSPQVVLYGLALSSTACSEGRASAVRAAAGSQPAAASPRATVAAEGVLAAALWYSLAT